VQEAAEIERDLTRRLDELHDVATRLYDRWTKGLSPGN
jgi:hypothetical protein